MTFTTIQDSFLCLRENLHTKHKKISLAKQQVDVKQFFIIQQNKKTRTELTCSQIKVEIIHYSQFLFRRQTFLLLVSEMWDTLSFAESLGQHASLSHCYY